MAERREKEDGSRLAWFLAGMAMGAAVGVFYAPRSGKDTRRYLSEKTQSGREAVSGTSKDIIETGRDLYERGRKLVDDAAELYERGRRLARG